MMMGGAWASPAEALVANAPSVESRLREAELFQRRANAQVGRLLQAEHLEFFGSGISNS